MTLSKPKSLLCPNKKRSFSKSSSAVEEQDREGGSCPASHAQSMEGKSAVNLTVILPLPPLHPDPSQHLSARLTSKDCIWVYALHGFYPHYHLLSSYTEEAVPGHTHVAGTKKQQEVLRVDQGWSAVPWLSSAGVSTAPELTPAR